MRPGKRIQRISASCFRTCMLHGKGPKNRAWLRCLASTTCLWGCAATAPATSNGNAVRPSCLGRIARPSTGLSQDQRDLTALLTRIGLLAFWHSCQSIVRAPVADEKTVVIEVAYLCLQQVRVSKNPAATEFLRCLEPPGQHLDLAGLIRMVETREARVKCARFRRAVVGEPKGWAPISLQAELLKNQFMITSARGH